MCVFIHIHIYVYVCMYHTFIYREIDRQTDR